MEIFRGRGFRPTPPTPGACVGTVPGSYGVMLTGRRGGGWATRSKNAENMRNTDLAGPGRPPYWGFPKSTPRRNYHEKSSKIRKIIFSFRRTPGFGTYTPADIQRTCPAKVLRRLKNRQPNFSNFFEIFFEIQILSKIHRK